MDHDRAKRLVELVLAPVVLVLLAPVLGVVALSVLLTLGRPVLYRGPRVGKGERVFEQLKFRTMTTRVEDASGRLLSDAERITGFGRFLRRYSLDELPQLVNILRGDMSFVGPRPLPCAYLPRYSATERRRHEVRPGLTGLAQSEGRNEVAWADKFALDVRYVERASFRMDLEILARSAWLVLRSRGISMPGHATAPEFLGSTGAEPVAGLAGIPSHADASR